MHRHHIAVKATIKAKKEKEKGILYSQYKMYISLCCSNSEEVKYN